MDPLRRMLAERACERLVVGRAALWEYFGSRPAASHGDLPRRTNTRRKLLT
ncbi:hypothetical protein [Streptomyces sp. NPDC060002]|uniref:hypothetical protein n=1 Tax=Streptomyces sp. NPDC060002 TaxID=3347033 RepID=UPI0036CFDB37